MLKWIVSMVCVLLLAGCGEKTPDLITVNFTCDISGTYDGMTFSGNLQRDMAGTLSLVLSAPENLSGMRLQYNGKEMTVSLGDLRYTQEMQLPETSVPTLILKALDDLFYAAGAKALVMKDAQVSGKAGEYTYCAQTDLETGELLSLGFPDAALSVRFSNVQRTA